MKILGIDPGLKATGYGLIQAKSKKTILLETGVIEPKKNVLLQFKIQQVYKSLEGIQKQYHPDVLVLEKIYAHYKHPATAMVMGHLRGAICLFCAQAKIELVEYSVKRIRKSVTGNGNATKVQTRRVVSHLLNIDESKLTLDASDALALALGYVQIHLTNII